jgi:hypothetical protein
MISREQTGALVALIRAIRPAWDSRAIRPVLEQLADGHDLAELAAAAIRTAEDPTMRTPTAITFDGDHWTTGSTTDNPAHHREPKCRVCGRTRTMCEQVRTKLTQRGVEDPHEFELRPSRSITR